MAILVSTPQLHLENGEATAFEIVAHTIDYVCQEMGEKVGKCQGCPLNPLCNTTEDGYGRADLFRKIAKEGKTK